MIAYLQQKAMKLTQVDCEYNRQQNFYTLQYNSNIRYIFVYY